MVDVGDKVSTERRAEAAAEVRFPLEVYLALKAADFHGKKGAIFHTAIIAGVQAVKRTDQLIPFCHSVALEHCEIDVQAVDASQCVRIVCRTRCVGKTGVEMEAMVGASVAALTIYDMTKALSLETEIVGPLLLSKSGGKRDYRREV